MDFNILVGEDMMNRSYLKYGYPDDKIIDFSSKNFKSYKSVWGTYYKDYGHGVVDVVMKGKKFLLVDYIEQLNQKQTHFSIVLSDEVVRKDLIEKVNKKRDKKKRNDAKQFDF